MSIQNGWGVLVDINVIEKRLSKLKKLLFNNEVASAKDLSDEILTNVTDLDTTLQAMTDLSDLAVDPSLPIRD